MYAPRQVRQLQMQDTRMAQYADAQSFIPNAGAYPQGHGVQAAYGQYNMHHPQYTYVQNTPPQQTFQFQPPMNYSYVHQGAYQNNVVLTSHINQNQPVRYNFNQTTPQQHLVAHHQPAPAPAPVAHKKGTAVVITDPNTGKDITNDIAKRKSVKQQVPPNSLASTTPPSTIVTQNEELKAQTTAKFAAQVLAAKENPVQKNKDDIKHDGDDDKGPSTVVDTKTVTPLVDKKPEVKLDKEAEIVEETVSPPDDVIMEETVCIEEEAVGDPVETSLEPDSSETEASMSIVPENANKNIENENICTEAEVLKQDSPPDEPKTNNLVSKKKKKLRYKDKDTDDSMLSAFVDKPDVPLPKPVAHSHIDENVISEVVEEVTWENKEIESHDLKTDSMSGEVEEITESSIIEAIDSDTDKRHYNRDFLLKFQFASICTSKPYGLPDIEVVLNEAHAPTKALIPGQKIQTPNDFIPNYMRQASGGRQSGGGRSKDRRGAASGNMPANQQKKVIQLPQFEKIELAKSDNAWVRPSEKSKEFSEEEKAMDEVSRNVRSILNKLTPQKFVSLVDKMNQLVIDTRKKLEVAINLIFEKAVSEPVFSVAYANMCVHLTKTFVLPVADSSGVSQNITFRKILLNKCQTEFDKDNSNEKLLEEDKTKKFETETEAKAWKVELENREVKNRRRMLGNIRFIGELFKLKMISEGIMHECVVKLLRSEKQESFEDQLECLCKLLSTIGKDLDHEQAKPRIDQYFTQLQRIIDKKKVSTRIKFAIKDIIDLRRNRWVPRRDDSNPKTIDQIHKEAEEKEREQDKMRQMDKMRNKDLSRQRGGGGRNSPSMRSEDGWITQKGKSIPQPPIVASKFTNFKKPTDTDDISLGPGRSGVWSKGSSGGGNSRNSSSTPTPNQISQCQNNRYGALSDSSTNTLVNDNHRSRSMKHSSKYSNRDDRSAAVKAVQDLTSRDKLTPTRPPTPPEDTKPTTIDLETLRKKTRIIVEDYTSVKDIKEACSTLTNLNAANYHDVFVEETLLIVIDKKRDDRFAAGELLRNMVKENVLSVKDLHKGLNKFIEAGEDLVVDIPLFYKYLGETIGPVILDSCLPLTVLQEILQPLVEKNKAAVVFAETVHVARDLANNDDIVRELFLKANIEWENILGKGTNIQAFLKKKSSII